MTDQPRTLTAARRFRFGLFEVDFDQTLVRKGGVRLRLQKQPLGILAALLERPGDVVTRDEIRRRLWPADVPPDSDHRINKAVNKLRNTLGDSAENPRFVATLARRGYRFIAPVEALDQSGQPVRESPAETIPPPRHRFLGWAAGVAVLAAVLFAAMWWPRPLPVPMVERYQQLTNDFRQKLDGIATDGRQVYFVEFHDGENHLTSVPLGGGPPSHIETNFAPGQNVFVLDISADGERLLLKTVPGVELDSQDGPIWVLPVRGGAAQRLGGLVANDAKWSPDGSKLAYFTGPDLFVADAGGAHPEKIASKPGLNSAIRWGPRGDVLRFRTAVSSVRHNAIWEADLTTGDLRPVFPGWAFEQHFGAWTSGGSYFLFDSPTDFDLWIAPSPGIFPGVEQEAPVPLTRGPLRFRCPSRLPDGDTIVAIGEVLRGDLLQWDAGVNQYVPYLGGLSADQLDFSRDGQLMTYVSYPEGTLWVANPDGSHRRRLTGGSLKVNLPRLSPDHSRIAFMAREPGKNWKIQLISSKGGKSKTLIPGEGMEADPNWSPDGKKIIYSIYPWDVGDQPKGIFVLDVATGKIERVPGSGPRYSPRWSPDGRTIAAIREGDTRIDLYDAGSRTWSHLTDLQGGFPAWSSDSRYLYLFHGYTEARGIYRVNVATGETVRLASLQGIDVAGNVGPFGLSLSLKDEPIILRDRSVQEIYALRLKLP